MCDHSAAHLRHATHVMRLFTDIAEETVSAHRHTVNLDKPSEFAGTKSFDGFAQEEMPFGPPRCVHLDPGSVCRNFHLQCIRKRKRNGLFQKHMQATFGTSEELRCVMNIGRRDESNVSFDALQRLAEFP